MSTTTNGYSIVKNSALLFGPVDWNPQTLQDYLFSVGVYVSLPINPISNISKKYLNVGSGYGICYTTLTTPDLNIDEKYTGGYTTVVGTNTVSITANVISLTADEISTKLAKIKLDLINSLKTYKDSVLTSGLTVSVSGTDYTLDIDADAQNNMYRTISIMDNTKTINWKLIDNNWAVFSKSQLQLILETAIEYTQKCFDKEKSLQSKIYALSDLKTASTFDIKSEWSNA